MYICAHLIYLAIYWFLFQFLHFDANNAFVNLNCINIYFYFLFKEVELLGIMTILFFFLRTCQTFLWRQYYFSFLPEIFLQFLSLFISTFIFHFLKKKNTNLEFVKCYVLEVQFVFPDEFCYLVSFYVLDDHLHILGGYVCSSSLPL